MEVTDQLYDLVQIETNEYEISFSRILFFKIVEDTFLDFYELITEKTIEL